MGYLAGFKVTFKKLFEERVTTEYPKEKRPKPPRFHGRHVLNRYEDGMEKCIGCELCLDVCPFDSISMAPTTDAQYEDGYFKIQEEIYEDAGMKFATNRNNNDTIEASAPKMAAE